MVHGLKQHHEIEEIRGGVWVVLGLGGIWSCWWTWTWRSSGSWRGGCAVRGARHGRGGSSPRWTQTRGPGSWRRAGFSEQGLVESNVLEVEGKPSRSWNSELEHCLFVIDYLRKICTHPLDNVCAFGCHWCREIQNLLIVGLRPRVRPRRGNLAIVVVVLLLLVATLGLSS